MLPILFRSGRAGDLIRSPEFQEYDLPVHLVAIRIRYHLRNANGQYAVTSGAALHLVGKAPQGWRLIAWAHAFARSRLAVRHEEPLFLRGIQLEGWATLI